MYTMVERTILDALRMSNVEQLVGASRDIKQEPFVTLLEKMLVVLKNEYTGQDTREWGEVKDRLLKAFSEKINRGKQEKLFFKVSLWNRCESYRVSKIYESVCAKLRKDDATLIARLESFLLNIKLTGFRFDTLLDLIFYVEINLKESGERANSLNVSFKKLVDKGHLHPDDLALYHHCITAHIKKGNFHPRMISAVKSLCWALSGESHRERVERGDFFLKENQFDMQYGAFADEQDFFDMTEIVKDERSNMRSAGYDETKDQGWVVEERNEAEGGGRNSPASFQAAPVVTNRGRAVMMADAGATIPPIYKLELEELYSCYQFSHLQLLASDQGEKELFARLRYIEEDAEYVNKFSIRKKFLNDFKKIWLSDSYSKSIKIDCKEIFSTIIGAFYYYRVDHSMINSLSSTLIKTFEKSRIVSAEKSQGGFGFA